MAISWRRLTELTQLTWIESRSGCPKTVKTMEKNTYSSHHHSLHHNHSYTHHYNHQKPGKKPRVGLPLCRFMTSAGFLVYIDYFFEFLAFIKRFINVLWTSEFTEPRSPKTVKTMENKYSNHHHSHHHHYVQSPKTGASKNRAKITSRFAAL